MSDPQTDPALSVECWDRYWSGLAKSGIAAIGVQRDPAIESWWRDLWSGLRERGIDRGAPPPSVLDLASGDGAMAARVQQMWPEAAGRVECVDYSQASIARIHALFPDVKAVVADVRRTPFDSARFDLVVSEFGVEYGGMAAVEEAARLITKDGALILMLEIEGGIRHRDCRDTLAALEEFRESRFVARAGNLFAAAFTALAGGNRADYDAAGVELQPAIHRVEEILATRGEHVAGDLLARIYEGVARIHQNLARHDRDEVLNWLREMDAEIAGYAGRMQSLDGAAIDRQAFDAICSTLRDSGFSVALATELREGDDGLPLAWTLIANRGDAFAWDRKSAPAHDARFRFTLTPEADVDRERLRAWSEQQFNAGMRELMARGVLSERFFEAKPAWVLPFQILIGRVRRPQDTTGFTWFICGEVPIDQLDAGAASTPREAARYFALKWQLAAARMDSGNGDAPAAADGALAAEGVAALAEKAEALYALVELDVLWR